MVRLNVEAVVDLTGRFLPGMVERGRGAIINIASTAAFQPLPGAANYAATKSFVLSFSEAIRTELRGTGVSVTAVCPGPVKTEFTEAAGMDGVEDSTPDAIWMSPEEIGRAAVEGAERRQAGRRARRAEPGRVPARPAHAARHRPAARRPHLGRGGRAATSTPSCPRWSSAASSWRGASGARAVSPTGAA